MSCGLRAGRQVWGEEHDEDRALSATSEQVEQDEGDRGGSVCAEALDAHRQVLEMAATIELLSKNFELMQRELSAAYARLEEYASNSPVGRESMNSTRPRPRLQGSPRHTECCTHQHEVDELRKLVEVKDCALKEALEQRNQHRVELEKAETMMQEMRALHPEATGGRGGAARKPVAATTSSGGCYPFGGTDSASARLQSTLSPSVSPRDLPHAERFDQGSAYQPKENDSLFWRKQYREAVQMRKKPNMVNMTTSNRTPQSNALKTENKPSLKIFSTPNMQRQRANTDENIPFSRYIGISSRQHEIIKEQHRILS